MLRDLVLILCVRKNHSSVQCKDHFDCNVKNKLLGRIRRDLGRKGTTAKVQQMSSDDGLDQDGSEDEETLLDI